MFKLEKWFTIFKNRNDFPKITKPFSVKRKIFSIDYYLMSHQTLENTVNIFQKSFYVETNGA
jgi:hypothetical protein